MTEEYVPLKEQVRTPEEELRGVEIRNLPDKDFKVMIQKYSINLGGEWMNTVRILTKS